jgi:hypothetical protein
MPSFSDIRIGVCVGGDKLWSLGMDILHMLSDEPSHPVDIFEIYT